MDSPWSGVNSNTDFVCSTCVLVMCYSSARYPDFLALNSLTTASCFAALALLPVGLTLPARKRTSLTTNLISLAFFLSTYTDPMFYSFKLLLFAFIPYLLSIRQGLNKRKRNQLNPNNRRSQTKKSDFLYWPQPSLPSPWLYGLLSGAPVIRIVR